MEIIQLIWADPTLLYFLVIIILSTIALIAIKIYKKKKNISGTEGLEDFIEEVQSDARVKFHERLEEKKEERGN